MSRHVNKGIDTHATIGVEITEQSTYRLNRTHSNSTVGDIDRRKHQRFPPIPLVHENL